MPMNPRRRSRRFAVAMCVLVGAMAFVLFAMFPSANAPLRKPVPAAPTVPAAVSSAPVPARAQSESRAKQEAVATPAQPTIAPLDRERAMDRIADHVARQKAGPGDFRDALWRKKFEQAPGNDAATIAMASQVEQALSTLDEAARAHVLVGSIECRGSQCEVLAAVNGIVEVRDENGEYGTHAPIDTGDLAKRIAELHGTPNDLRFEFNRGSAKDDYGIFWLRFDEPSPAL